MAIKPMEWQKLLSNVRLGREDAKNKNIFEGRTNFQRDYDRIAFSSPFKRLQNKTQVIPLPESELIRNRLTHSFETSCVGRSLGEIAGEAILTKYPSLAKAQITKYDFSSIVAAACLAHDIGNPPFGHAGEDAVSEFYQSEKAKKYLDGLTEKQQADLQHFEGNAAGFRTIVQTLPFYSTLTGGLNLTYATLASFAKYPKESLPDLKGNGRASEKKYGFFQSEKTVFERIAHETGLIEKNQNDDLLWCRHPLAFLVEAADDICYHVIDFEDGYELGLIDFNIIENVFKEIVGEKIANYNYYDNFTDEKDKVMFLRSIAINELVKQSAEQFIINESEILAGRFDTPLTKGIDAASSLEQIEKLTIENIFHYRPILEVEAAGFKVIDGLLDTFLQGVFNKSSKWSKKLLDLIPLQYVGGTDNYTKILNVTMYISSLSDNQALNLSRRLHGFSL